MKSIKINKRFSYKLLSKSNSELFEKKQNRNVFQDEIKLEKVKIELSETYSNDLNRLTKGLTIKFDKSSDRDIFLLTKLIEILHNLGGDYDAVIEKEEYFS